MDHVRNAPTLVAFRQELKTVLFRECLGSALETFVIIALYKSTFTITITITISM